MENCQTNPDALGVILQIQDKKRRQAESSQRYRKTQKGRLSVQRGIVSIKERYATNPEFRAKELKRSKKNKYKKDWIAVGISKFRQMLKSHGSPVHIFCRGNKFILVPENLGDQKAWRKWVVDGQRIGRTFDAMYQQMPKAFVGTYDANIDTRELRQDIHCFLARSTSVVRKSIANEIPLPTLNKNIPCKDCEYEKPCRILGLTCPRYVSWQKGSSYKKQPRIPDKYLDGTIPPPSVL